MRRTVWMLGLLGLAVAGCESDAINNSRSVAYLINDASQIPQARQQAAAECQKYNREAGLYNVTQFEQLPEILPTVDQHLGALVRAELEFRRVTVLTGTTVRAISRAARGADHQHG